jgi:hypothetical protein
MARKLRIQYAGAIYHVRSRGDRREDIFFDDVDRQISSKPLISSLSARLGLTTATSRDGATDRSSSG